jgi:heme/copper-type cytochrome/quinol oxidase subunit 1
MQKDHTRGVKFNKLILLKLLKKPHLIFWAVIPLLLFQSFYQDNQTLDVNIHDTYYVFSQQQSLVLLSLFFGLTGLIYWLLKNFNFKTLILLNVLHLIFTIGIILMNSIRYFLLDYFLGTRYYTITNIPDTSIWWSILAIITGQIIFIINIILSILKGTDHKTKVQ